MSLCYLVTSHGTVKRLHVVDLVQVVTHYGQLSFGAKRLPLHRAPGQHTQHLLGLHPTPSPQARGEP